MNDLSELTMKKISMRMISADRIFYDDFRKDWFKFINEYYMPGEHIAVIRYAKGNKDLDVKYSMLYSGTICSPDREDIIKLLYF